MSVLPGKTSTFVTPTMTVTTMVADMILTMAVTTVDLTVMVHHTRLADTQTFVLSTLKKTNQPLSISAYGPLYAALFFILSQLKRQASSAKT